MSTPDRGGPTGRGPGKESRPSPFPGVVESQRRDGVRRLLQEEGDMSMEIIVSMIAAAETLLGALLGELAAICAGDVPAVPYLTGLEFDEMLGLIEALPPDTPDM